MVPFEEERRRSLMPFTYPDPDSAEQSFEREQMARAYDAYGAKDPAHLFGSSPMTPAPWPRASRRKNQEDYDPEIVAAALRGPRELQPIDPRKLHATQPSITRQGVDYYLTDEYKETGRTFADQGNPGNRHPVVYDREDGQSMLLSGHHRGASALLSAEEFGGIRVAGPWGPMRGRR
jgi:hypothetical protein